MTEDGHGERDKRHGKRTRKKRTKKGPDHETDPQIRSENEDDDGYDPYSDRAPEREPLFERDPWT